MSTVERFVAAKQQQDQAQVTLQDLAERLQAVAAKLAHPEDGLGIRQEQYTLPTPQSEATVKQSEYPSWEEIANAIETYHRASEVLDALESTLTPQERALLELST